MADTLAEARANVHAAQLAKETLIARAVEGEAVTDQEMLEADQAADRAERLLKLEEAKAVGSRQRAKLAQIDDLRKKAVALDLNWNDSLMRLVAAAEAVDDAKAALEEESPPIMGRPRPPRRIHGRRQLEYDVAEFQASSQ